MLLGFVCSALSECINMRLVYEFTDYSVLLVYSLERNVDRTNDVMTLYRAFEDDASSEPGGYHCRRHLQ